jgi:hypothetical protein
MEEAVAVEAAGQAAAAVEPVEVGEWAPDFSRLKTL